ncbi:WD40 repeat domain-containing protein [Trinickia fusca]|nr:WD40 repeat domain-containing protein [Trinickia fusca]
MTASAVAAPRAEASSSQVSAHADAPKLDWTIRRGVMGLTGPTIKKVSFSPDSRYLAIVESPSWLETDISVWDLEQHKEQAHIHCPFNYADSLDDDLLWIHDGKVITFGAKKQWNPMTGEALHDNPAIGRSARLNKDRTKMLTIVGAIGEPTTIHVYDTRTWALQKIELDGLESSVASWTADDKILVSVSVVPASHGKTIDGRVIDWYDSAVRLIDPSGKSPTKAVWFPPTKMSDQDLAHSFPIGARTKTNFATNEVVLESGEIVDAATLAIRRYHSFDPTDDAPGSFGYAFSPDGKRIYLKGSTFVEKRKTIDNTIVDTASGKPLVQFSGALDGVADLDASPDGKTLAIGSEHSVLIYRLR